MHRWTSESKKQVFGEAVSPMMLRCASRGSLSETKTFSWMRDCMLPPGAVWMNSAFFWVVIQRGLVVIYRSFGTNYPVKEVQDNIGAFPYITAYVIVFPTFFLDCLDSTVCPETSVNNCQYTLRNISEEPRSFSGTLSGAL